ncbi:MAG: DUF952 domain-containing protein [Kordiimonadaceae bacterium]|nr:DUF952 domain-containing protein [Kordiimonadaceae bacterium]
MMFKNDFIYKICTKSEWKEATVKGIYKGSSDDIRDGFIHFSAIEQVKGTLEKHFKNQKDLVLLKIAIDRLPIEALKWEKSRSGQKFPHLYNDLNLGSVVGMEELPDQD